MKCACQFTDRGPLVMCAAHQSQIDSAVRSEREACAAIVDKMLHHPHPSVPADALVAAARAIRSRSKG